MRGLLGRAGDILHGALHGEDARWPSSGGAGEIVMTVQVESTPLDLPAHDSRAFGRLHRAAGFNVGEDFAELIESHGGQLHPASRRRHRLLVVGQKDWPLTRAGTLRANAAKSARC